MSDYVWKGSAVSNAGELLDAVTGLLSEQEGAEFMAGYTDHLRSKGIEDAAGVARSNVGYVIGYLGGSDAESSRERDRLHALTGAGHPIFGGSY